MDWSLPGSSVHGIFQARILEWVAISSSRGSDPGIKPVAAASPALQGDSLPMSLKRIYRRKVVVEPHKDARILGLWRRRIQSGARDET